MTAEVHGASARGDGNVLVTAARQRECTECHGTARFEEAKSMLRGFYLRLKNAQRPGGFCQRDLKLLLASPRQARPRGWDTAGQRRGFGPHTGDAERGNGGRPDKGCGETPREPPSLGTAWEPTP